ncbi:hypothetical protein, partial [Escherichia coli]|uniref:hypothetical protein n=1 Tax=Escherichia coli TaxID=562 RepID=UPI001F4B4F63
MSGRRSPWQSATVHQTGAQRPAAPTSADRGDTQNLCELEKSRFQRSFSATPQIADRFSEFGGQARTLVDGALGIQLGGDIG